MTLAEALALEEAIYQTLRQRTEDARKAEFEYNSLVTDEEIDTALENAPPVEPSEGFRERALKAMRDAGKRRAVRFN